jgi:hypothetical protein
VPRPSSSATIILSAFGRRNIVARIVGRHRLKWLDRLRWYLDRVQGRPRHQVKADPRPSPGLRLPDDVAERNSRTDPPKGHAGDPDDARGMRHLDARAMGRGESAAAAVAGCRPDDCCAWCRQGGPRGSGMIRTAIRESPRVDVSRPSRCSCSCWHSAARGRAGLSSSSTKASQIVRRASWRRRSARTDVSDRVPMDARMVQDG